MDEDTNAATSPAGVTGPMGLGGWLILPAINMAWQLLMLVLGVLGLAMLRSGDSSVLPAGLDASDPAWIRLLDYEFSTSVLMAFLLLVLFVLFFTRSWLFPKAIIAFWSLNVLLQLFDLMQVHGVASLDASAFHGSYTELVKPVIYCVVWGAYFTQSVRVRNTFTRPWPVAKAASTASS